MTEIAYATPSQPIPDESEAKKFERIPTQIYGDSEAASFYAANEIAELIRQRQKQGKKAVIGLATGSTPTKMYEFLVRFHHRSIGSRHEFDFRLMTAEHFFHRIGYLADAGPQASCRDT